MGMWWKNIGPKAESIPVGNGNVAAVKPQGVVEVAAETEGLRRLRRQGKIVRSGRPEHPDKVRRPVAVMAEPDRTPASTEFAQHVAERGMATNVADVRRENVARKEQRAAAAADAAPVEQAAAPVAVEAVAVDGAAAVAEEAPSAPEGTQGAVDAEADGQVSWGKRRNRHAKP